MPGGSTITWSNEKDFTDTFSLFLMRKTAAAYHVVPTDLGFTENSNLNTGESQGDVQHRVGDLPLMAYAEEILSRFLFDDLALPLVFAFDRGEEQDDRYQQAQADDVYVKNGTVGTEELREMRYGLPRSARPVPRFVFSERGGPVPLIALMAVGGDIDPQTGAPTAEAVLPRTAFTEVEGVENNPPLLADPLAVEEFGPSALPPAPPMQPMPPGQAPVSKDGGGAPAAGATEGITSETGITSYDLDGRHHQDEDDEDRGEQTQKAVAEQARTVAINKDLAAFGRFAAARRKAGKWRDFEFRTIGGVHAHRLNDAGRLNVRKAAGEIAVAGLAVQAGDTGRVLMLQRALDPGDPAAGTWEFPGGHVESGESPLRAAWREWAEETGAVPPPGVQGSTWTSPDGIYQGIVWSVDCEASVPVRCGTQITNPDDPDGDAVEAIAWWDPEQLPGNPAVRPELAADMDAVMAALGCTPAGDCCGADCCAWRMLRRCGRLPVRAGRVPSAGDEATCPCGTPVVYDEGNGWQHADGSISHDDGESVSGKMAAIAKAGGAGPKGDWPGWAYDLQTAGHWAPLVAAALAGAVSRARAGQLAAAYLLADPPAGQDEQGKRDQVAAAAAWLARQGVDLAGVLVPLVPGFVTDGWLIGGASAAAVATGQPVDVAGWQPGDTSAAAGRAGQLGLTAGLDATLADAGDIAGQMAAGYLTTLGRVLVDAAAGEATPAAAGAALTGALADAGHAAATVLDQITGAAGQAALAVYQAVKVRYGRWVTEGDGKVCAVCAANAAAGRVRIGDPYPSGDIAPPAHDRCRCAPVPG